METKPARMQVEREGELVVTLDPRGDVAEVRRAEPGLPSDDAFVVRPGESLYEVPYAAWLARVDQSVRLRELRNEAAQGWAPDGWQPEKEDGEPWTRSGKSFWTTRLSPKALMVFLLTGFVAKFPEWFREASEGGTAAAFFIFACLAVLWVVLTVFLEVELPRWVGRVLMVGGVLIALIELVIAFNLP